MIRLASFTLIGCFLAAAGSLAAEPASITVQLPESFPVELSTVISARLNNVTGDASTFQLKDDRLGPASVLAQREVGTDRVWLTARVRDQQLLGSSAKIQVTPQSVTPLVTITSQPEGFQFWDQGRKVMFYQQQPASDGEYTRANFVHPLLGLDGEVLTQAFPEDHKHHHGVFWAWHQLWVGELRAGDPWVTSDFLATVRDARVVEQGPVFCTLRIVADWTSPLVRSEDGQPKPIISEKTQIRLFHASGDSRWIDFQIQLQPLLPNVKIGGAENSRGYSGFTVRLKPPAKMSIQAASGEQTEDLVGEASGWADVSGVFATGGQPSGLSILSHRSLPEFPPRWLLRYYGMQNVVYPGREPVQLSAQQPLMLRHRLLIHRGDAETARVADQQKAYQDQP